MSILIKGMEMPTERESFNLTIKYNGVVLDTEMGMQIAEAYELPPHGRLGDLDVLYSEMETYSDYYGAKEYHDDEMIHRDSILYAIEQAPTIIEAEEEKTKESLCLNCQSKTCWNEGFDTGVHNCKAYSPYQSDTNYSRIRSLSIYEMADELQVLIDEAVWSGEGKSNNELLEWLKSSAEEGE